MALRLNRSKDFGKISPPYQRDDWDRPAVAEQDGHFFDTQDHEVIAGVACPATIPDDDQPRAKSTSQLIAAAYTMPYSQFRLEAMAVLGKSCPGGKAQILAALKRLQRNGDKRHDEQNNGQASANSAAPATGVDLAAWGRGKKSYLFAEVRKAIRSRFNSDVTTTRDAVSLLINERVVPAADARAD